MRGAVAVAVGGAAGAIARYAVAQAAVSMGVVAPWATLTVNLLGSLLMGLLIAVVIEHPERHPLWRPLLGVGFLGGFTTFSAFAGDAVLLADSGDWLAATGYVVVTVVGGLLALVAGAGLGRRWRGAAAR